jgi:hypothetical protein
MSEEQKLPSYEEILKQSGQEDAPVPETELEFKSVPAEVIEAVTSALESVHARTFSGRHPELGKMIKCQVCGTRHRLNERTCVQKFAYLHTIEDTETGEKTDVTRELKPESRNGVIGAAAFRGKRIKSHLNRRKRRFIEIVRDIIPDEYTQEDMLAARKKAAKIGGMGDRKSYGTMAKPEKGKSKGALKFAKQRKMGF